MTTMNADHVGVGSAPATGAIFVAPKGTTLPTDATTTLSGFTLLGFTSDAGVQISEESSTEAIRAWEGRAEIYNVRSEYTESITFMPIQCDADVAKLIWGESMVEVDSETGAIHAKHHGGNIDPVVIAIEVTPRENIVKRYCGTFQLVERGEQTMDGTQVDGRELTFNSIADENGVTMHEHTAFIVETDTSEDSDTSEG